MKYLIIFFLLFITLISKAQSVTEEVEMADAMRSNGKIYVVVAVIATVFAGIVVYLVNLDSKISKIENKIKQ
jgi:CcmD family protein